MMAGHPYGVSMLSLRNVRFALQVGGKDNAYDRVNVGRPYGEQLAMVHTEVGRTMAVMIRTLAERGDPRIVMNGEVVVQPTKVSN